MKKLYILMVAIFVTTISFGQGPIITMISDGDCAGGNPKVLEIYANGSVDFTQYSLEIQTNSNTTWSNTFDLSALGTVTDSFVYLYKESTAGIFAAEYPSATTTLEVTTSVLNFNGDDRIRIIETASGTVIDQYGVSDTDGTGTAWEYKDGYAKRIDGNANAGAFNPANWSFNNGVLNNQGTCQGGATFESIIGLGTYTVPTGPASPTLAITSPANGSTVPSGDVTVTFAVANFVVATAGNGDGHIKYTVDAGAAIMKYDTTPIALTGLSTGAHTVAMELVDDNDASLNTPITATVNFTVQAYTQVANISALRNGTIGDAYELTGEAFINFAQSYRHQKYIQDATAGILIDDNAGNITAGARGDGLSGVKGTLGEYKGMLQFIPLMDATVVSPSNLTITPQVITLADLTNNFEDYEAELVTVENVMIDNTPDVNFVNGMVYPMTSGADTFNFRASFYNVDYIGTAVPTVPVDVTGLPNEKTGTGATDFGVALTARDAADIVIHTAAVSENTIKGFNVYPNPAEDALFVNTLNTNNKTVELFSIIGKRVYANNTNATNFTVNISKLNGGLYILKVSDGTHTSIQKVVIK